VRSCELAVEQIWHRGDYQTVDGAVNLMALIFKLGGGGVSETLCILCLISLYLLFKMGHNSVVWIAT
jgi:hypothetical protein